jgi:hypothetical protein
LLDVDIDRPCEGTLHYRYYCLPVGIFDL